MRIRLPENLLYRLLALGFAIALHFYVVGQENPSQSRTLLVPLTVRGLAPGLIFDDKSAPQISITLSGPADLLTRLPSADIRAIADLSKAHAGKNPAQAVHVILPPGESGLSVETLPSVVAINLFEKAKRLIPITASDPGTPPAGFRFGAARITPHTAMVEGSREAVASVQQIVANVETGQSVGTVDDDFSLVALDVQGAQVTNVTLSPPTAHVLVKMSRVPSSRTLFVNADLSGTPAYPYRVTGVDVSPLSVTVAGRPEVLAQVSTVQTAPIDVSRATSDLSRVVACIPPAGLVILAPREVTVTVHVALQPAATAPVPPPSVITPNEPKL